MMHLAYVIGTFPSLSETFILREISELERQGEIISIFALWRDRKAAGTDNCWAERTTYARCPFAPSVMAKGLFFSFSTLKAHQQLWRVFKELSDDPGNLVRYGIKYCNVARGFAWDMKRRGVERVHAHFAGLTAFVGTIAAELSGARFSFSVHAGDLYQSPGQVQWAAETADIILTCNEAVTFRLKSILPGCLHEKIHLVHHGIVPCAYSEGRKDLHERDCIILSVGRLVPKKGHDDFLRALGELDRQGVPFRAEIIGDGPEAESLRILRNELGLEERVDLPGALPHEAVIKKMQNARIFALACKRTAAGDEDGIPNVLLEAAAAGIPIVSCAAGGVPEFVKHEETGILVTPGAPRELASGIQRLLNDEILCEKVCAGAFDLVCQEFDLAENVKAIKTLFERHGTHQ